MPWWAWLAATLLVGAAWGYVDYRLWKRWEFSVTLVLAVLALAIFVWGPIAYGIFAGVTRIDPLGFHPPETTDIMPARTGPVSAGACDSNYQGGCVPDTYYDVDCDEVQGYDLSVVGTDVNGLDRDGDGLACEA